jgi:hypothetical protein
MNSREAATRYRLSQWAQTVQERAASGESIDEFCQRAGISRNKYFYWQKKLRDAACEHLSLSQGTEPSFAEIKLEAHQLALPPAATPGQIRVDVCGFQITADSTYPADKLATLLRELKRP